MVAENGRMRGKDETDPPRRLSRRQERHAGGIGLHYSNSYMYIHALLMYLRRSTFIESYFLRKNGRQGNVSDDVRSRQKQVNTIYG